MEDIYRALLQKAAAGQYDENALPSYTHPNRLMSWLFWKRIDTALSFMRNLPGKTILDFGCGGAVTFKFLSQRHCTIVGCDENISLAQQVCEALYVNAELHQNLCTVRGHNFDYILALDVLEHIQKSGALIDDFKKLLKSGGKVILSGPTENFWYKAGRKLAGFSGHYHVKNVYQIEQEFAARGFAAEKVCTLYHPVPLFRVSVWAT